MKFRLIKGEIDSNNNQIYYMQLFRYGNWEYLIKGGWFKESNYEFSKNQNTQTGGLKKFYSQQEVEEEALRIDNNSNRVTKEGYIIEKEFTGESLRFGE